MVTLYNCLSHIARGQTYRGLITWAQKEIKFKIDSLKARAALTAISILHIHKGVNIS